MNSYLTITICFFLSSDLVSFSFVQTSLLLIFFVSLSFFSKTFGFKDGGRTLECMTGLTAATGAGGACDFLTICRTTLGLFRSFLRSLGPPGSGVAGVLVLSGRRGSKASLSGRLAGGLAGSARFSLTFDEGSVCGAAKE